jgi:hypothetical protein
LAFFTVTHRLQLPEQGNWLMVVIVMLRYRRYAT